MGSLVPIRDGVMTAFADRVMHLIGDADRVAYGLTLLEHGQRQVRDIWPRNDHAVGKVAVYRRPVRPSERSVGQARWPDRSPVQAPVAQQVLHGGEVGVEGAKSRRIRGLRR